MGGNFGNKNQNQDADLIAAMLAKEAGAPVKLELSRKEDFIGMHGRWPTIQYYTVGTTSAGTLQAIRLRAYSGMGPYRKNTGNIGGIDLYQCPNIETVVTPVYTNKTVSGNLRGPEYPQGFYGIQSMMDDVASKLKMDPVEFILKNMTRLARNELPYTNYSLEECIRRGAEAFEWKSGLDHKVLEAREFYAIIAFATLGGVLLDFTPVDPIRALFWSAVINGVIAVPIMIVMMLLADDHRVMAAFTVTRRLKALGWLATWTMAAAVVAMFVSGISY